MARRGRPIKAKVNGVVYVQSPRHGLPFFGVIIDYRTDRTWARYLIVETDWKGGHPRGAAQWRDSGEFTPTDRTSRPPGRIHRANNKLGPPEMRGCGCECCVHVAGVEPEPSE